TAARFRSTRAAASPTCWPSKACSCCPARHSPMLIAQLSDPHIGVPGTLLYGRVDTADFLTRAVAEINWLEPSPDITVLTGDLVAIGEAPEYEDLPQILAPLPLPLFVIPG